MIFHAIRAELSPFRYFAAFYPDRIDGFFQTKKTGKTVSSKCTPKEELLIFSTCICQFSSVAQNTLKRFSMAFHALLARLYP
jgi:hypothetical protein